MKMKKRPLRLVPGSRSLVLPALDGSRLIRNALETFSQGIDDSRQKLEPIKRGSATPEIRIQIHDIYYHATPLGAFKSLPGLWSQKCFSQDQIIEFCKNFTRHIPQSGCAFFILKKNENSLLDESDPSDGLVLACVEKMSNGLNLAFYPFTHSYACLGGESHIVVSPQLARPAY